MVISRPYLIWLLGLMILLSACGDNASTLPVESDLVSEWAMRAELLEPNSEMVVTELDGQIYVVGGRFGSGFRSEMTDVLEVYDPETSSWASKSAMPTVRGGLNAIAADGCLHVFGGEGGSSGSIIHQVVKVEKAC